MSEDQVQYPTITESRGYLTCYAVTKDTVFGNPLPPNAFLPITSNEPEEDPGWFSHLGVGVETPAAESD